MAASVFLLALTPAIGTAATGLAVRIDCSDRHHGDPVCARCMRWSQAMVTVAIFAIVVAFGKDCGATPSDLWRMLPGMQ